MILQFNALNGPRRSLLMYCRCLTSSLLKATCHHLMYLLAILITRQWRAFRFETLKCDRQDDSEHQVPTCAWSSSVIIFTEMLTCRSILEIRFKDPLERSVIRTRELNEDSSLNFRKRRALRDAFTARKASLRHLEVAKGVPEESSVKTS